VCVRVVSTLQCTRCVSVVWGTGVGYGCFAGRLQAVFALAIITLVCSTEDSTNDKAVACVEGLIRGVRTDPEVRIAALEAWALLHTTVSGREMPAIANRYAQHGTQVLM